MMQAMFGDVGLDGRELPDIARLIGAGRGQRLGTLRAGARMMIANLVDLIGERVTQREPRLGIALVATASERGQVRVVALAELAHDPAAPTAAELAVLVRDDAQRQGVGTGLLRLLIALAGGRGVRRLRATLQADNWAARQLLRKLARGLPY